MTRDEILTMPAGRTMDRRIVEYVMEWQKLSCGWIDAKNKSIVRPEFWQPSENIEYAFEVIEHLREKLGTCKFYIIIDPKKGDNIRAVFDPILDDEYFEASADTAPLAICRSALLAVMK